jgi:hypothetical protein
VRIEELRRELARISRFRSDPTELVAYGLSESLKALAAFCIGSAIAALGAALQPGFYFVAVYSVGVAGLWFITTLCSIAFFLYVAVTATRAVQTLRRVQDFEGYSSSIEATISSLGTVPSVSVEGDANS